MTFKSKHDTVMLAIAGGGALFLGLSVFEIWRASASIATQGWITLLGVVGLALIIWSVLGTRYTVGDEALEIRSGLLRWRITLGSIRSVEPAQGLDFSATSPAWSLDRLRITTDEGDWLLSPRDKGAFLDALGARDTHLRRDGERLVRAAA